MAQKKSDAYYRYRSEQARGFFPYFEVEEIEDIMFDLLDDYLYSEALEVVNMGLKQHKDDEELVKLKILILIHMNCIEEAQSLFSPYKDDGTESTETLNFAFEVAAGRELSAIRRMATRLHKGEMSSLDYVNLIDEMWEEISSYGKHRAIEAAEKYIHDNTEALARVAAMCMDLNMQKRALPLLEKALDIDAYDIYLWQDLARCAFELRMIDKCEEACEFGIAIDPYNPLLHFVRGFIMASEKENFEEALESLEVCRKYFEGELQHDEINIPIRELQAQFSMTYDLLALCYSKLDEIDKAIENYEKLLVRVPDNHEIKFAYTQALLLKGDYPKALEIINEAIKVQKRNTAYLALKASRLASMHSFDEALETLDRLIKIKPKSKSFVLAKAELALGIKKYDVADKAFRKLLTMKPKEETMRRLMKDYFLSIGDNEAIQEIDSL